MTINRMQNKQFIHVLRYICNIKMLNLCCCEFNNIFTCSCRRLAFFRHKKPGISRAVITSSGGQHMLANAVSTSEALSVHKSV